MSVSEFKLSWPMIEKVIKAMDKMVFAHRGIHLKEAYVDFIKDSFEAGQADDFTNAEDFVSVATMVWADHRDEFDPEINNKGDKK